MDNRDLFRLDGKTAIVTGANVVLASRKLDDLKKVEAHIHDRKGHALAVACHTGHAEEVTALVDAAVARFGSVDVLVNNAATNPYFGPLADTPEAAWQKTFEVNALGYFLVARAVIKHLLGRGAHGSIINVASVAGMRAAPMQGVYGMTKAAVISMTQTLAFEVGGQGIRVNAIAPGLIETRFAAAIVHNEALRSHAVSRTPLGRHGQPAEIVGAALYLASDAGSFCNGATLVVDGGMTIT
jgi:NAD(P)-dependent dehydrogenase (short-subunit alcohol dehydrogenase family)